MARQNADFVVCPFIPPLNPPGQRVVISYIFALDLNPRFSLEG